MRALQILSRLLWFSGLAALALCAYLVVIGFPAPDWMNEITKLKDIRKPFQLFLLLFFASILIHPKRKEYLVRLHQVLSQPAAFWVLLAVYTGLFCWHEIADYLAIEINFLPFSFYDYMLHYFGQGKIHFTGYLHGFYHVNNAMFLLWPVWKLFQSPLVLIVSYPFILAGASIPLYFLARKFFPDSAVAFVVAFAYLNFRYLANLLEMNFAVEGFYPLFIFSAFYFAAGRNWAGFFACVALSLSVKEDAPFYMAALGFLFLWMRGMRFAGLATIIISAAYFYWLHHGLIAWTGTDIFEGDMRNFSKYGGSFSEMARYAISHPLGIFQDFLGSKEAWKTLLKAFGHLLFLPLASPFVPAVLAALFPLFVRGGASFTGLQFQYASPFIGFIFPALVDGLSRIWQVCLRFGKAREILFSTLLVFLVFLNGGNYKTPSISQSDLTTIGWARSVPQGAVFVTHGHLLPYIGYRSENFYFQAPLENPNHPLADLYDNADYYLLVRDINLYPMSPGWFEEKLAKLEARNDYELAREDGTRYLFRRKSIGLS